LFIANARAADCLREPQKIDAILGALRDAVTIPFTVKTRLGFESPEEFDALLKVICETSD
jgi:tRNA-dihydrouridine synthase B